MDREMYRREWKAYLEGGVDGVTITLATDEAAVVAEALGTAVFAGDWTDQEIDILSRVATELTQQGGK